MKPHRIAWIAMATLSAAALAGCASRWERPLQADGSYCYVFGKQKKSVCTPEAVPSAAADLQAKQFAADTAAFTLYVVRHSSNDGIVRVPIAVDGSAPMVTVPESMVRMRLKPGSHQITATWNGKTVSQAVQGQAGEVQFVQLAGSVWAWGGEYKLETGDQEHARKLALKSRLVADVGAL